MGVKVLEFPAEAAARLVFDAVQALGGYPHESPRVGGMCHGGSYSTLRWSHIQRRSSDGVYEIVFPDHLDGMSTTVRGQLVALDRMGAVDAPQADRTIITGLQGKTANLRSGRAETP